ncbi:hypothetical protein BDZ91DRAFT_272538 [Kalaharituber pfeilii]|nr:hypothetical protein BDZ91DRAFT_272538 [Kalaharituber pfeilii]
MPISLPLGVLIDFACRGKRQQRLLFSDFLFLFLFFWWMQWDGGWSCEQVLFGRATFRAYSHFRKIAFLLTVD